MDACRKPYAHSISIASHELDDLAVRLRAQQEIAKLSDAKTHAGRKVKGCGKKLASTSILLLLLLLGRWILWVSAVLILSAVPSSGNGTCAFATCPLSPHYLPKQEGLDIFTFRTTVFMRKGRDTRDQEYVRSCLHFQCGRSHLVPLNGLVNTVMLELPLLCDCFQSSEAPDDSKEFKNKRIILNVLCSEILKYYKIEFRCLFF